MSKSSNKDSDVNITHHGPSTGENLVTGGLAGLVDAILPPGSVEAERDGETARGQTERGARDNLNKKP